MLFEFDDVSRTQEVLLMGSVLFEDRILQLDWWGLEVGCLGKSNCKVWGEGVKFVSSSWG